MKIELKFKKNYGNKFTVQDNGSSGGDQKSWTKKEDADKCKIIGIILGLNLCLIHRHLFKYYIKS